MPATDQAQANSKSGCLGCLGLLILVSIAYNTAVFLFNLVSGNLVWQQSPQQKVALCARIPEQIDELTARKASFEQDIHNGTSTASESVDLLRKIDEIDKEIVQAKESSTALGCQSVKAETMYIQDGGRACIKYLSSVSGYQAKLAQKYQADGQHIDRIWYIKDKSKPSAYSLAECRRSGSAGAAGMLEWREIKPANSNVVVPLSDWSSGDELVWYEPDSKCYGMSLTGCLKTEEPSESPVAPDGSYSLALKCKVYIADIMGRDPASMSEDYASGSIVGISYIRDDDGKKFKYECTVDDGEIVWRGVDIFSPGEGPGRWRYEDAKPLDQV